MIPLMSLANFPVFCYYCAADYRTDSYRLTANG